jgi:hypothetical protein
MCHHKKEGSNTTRPLCCAHSYRMRMGVRLSNQQHNNGIDPSPKLLSFGPTKPQ